jgi:glycosyltransferase involved in cell wall biosynthesis
MTIHHKWLQIYEKNIDLLIAPSEFMRRLVIDSGWPEEKIITLYNPAPKVTDETLRTEQDYLLYFGRLAPEKGIVDLIRAAKSSHKKLHIAGTGPMEKDIRAEFGAEIKNGQIQLLGQLTGPSLNKEIASARAVVFPSIWPENMPLALLESLAQGKIVIAARVGGLPEIIRDQENGFLFKAGDIKGLEAVIKKVFLLQPEVLKKMRLEAIKSAKKLDPDAHLKKIIAIYSKLAKKSG